MEYAEYTKVAEANQAGVPKDKLLSQAEMKKITAGGYQVFDTAYFPPIATPGSTIQYSPIRTAGPISASGETTAVGAIRAEGSMGMNSYDTPVCRADYACGAGPGGICSAIEALLK